MWHIDMLTVGGIAAAVIVLATLVRTCLKRGCSVCNCG